MSTSQTDVTREALVTSRKEVKPLVTSRRRECDVKKKMARGRLPGSTSKLHATASPPSRGRGRMHKFCLRSLGSLWFWFDDFPRKGSERARRRSSGRGRLPTCRTAAATHFYWKIPCRGKVHAVQSPNSSLSKGAKSYHAVRSRRCPKSDAVKKKKSQNLAPAGIWLDRACESEASDSSGRVPWPGRIETSTRHVPGPVTGIWLVSFRTFS